MPTMGTIDRAQTWFSLTLWSVICLTLLSVGLLAHFSPVMRRNIASDLARHREINGVFPFTGGYIDPLDYLFLDQLPKRDYSRGGVYFIGASDTMISIMPWELVPAERKLIHNYAIGGLSQREARHFLRCLVEEYGLLQAGGEKTTVFLGLFYGMTQKKSLQFQRHGLYSYDSDKGIHRTPMPSFARFLRIEEVYASRFLHNLIMPKSEIRVRSDLGPAGYRARWIEVMGEDWHEEMEKQMRDLELLTDYLQERKVRLHVILPPQGTWHTGLPFAEAYIQMLTPLLQKHGVPITDMRHFLPDEDYGDATHYAYSGHWKVHHAYRRLALQALAEMGIEPEPVAAGSKVQGSNAGIRHNLGLGEK
jgi:hypothetical protein